MGQPSGLRALGSIIPEFVAEALDGVGKKAVTVNKDAGFQGHVNERESCRSGLRDRPQYGR